MLNTSIKKSLLCTLIALLLLFSFGCQAAGHDAPDDFTDSEKQLAGFLGAYENNPAIFKGMSSGNFSSDEDSAPSDDELTRMLDFAMVAASSHMVSPAHFIVIRDYEEQTALLNGLGNDTATPGTVTILVLADTVRLQEYHTEPYNDWYQQSYYGIFDTGSATGYLTIAANSLGYKTHLYAALNLPVNGVIDITHSGQFDLIQENGWDIEKYLTSKDGSSDFRHTIGTYSLDTGSKEIPAAGNLSLLCAIVIGKASASADSITSATQSAPTANYNFWDPQDG
ncbi:hypothetical protein LJC56_09840 [Christensenellaceae bacterium OttesenSCG-928-K19]|nr:hypothetical protein [Christensenellaceae bacterium OttesenSCG-928-K19]